MLAACISTANVQHGEAMPIEINSPAPLTDSKKKEVRVIVEVGTSSKNVPYAMKSGLDYAKGFYVDTFMKGWVSSASWSQMPARSGIMASLEEFDQLVHKVENNFIKSKYDYPVIIFSEGSMHITSRQISHRKNSCKEGSRLKPMKISPEEAYELAQKTRMSYKEKWRAYAKEEARRLSLFESDD